MIKEFKIEYNATVRIGSLSEEELLDFIDDLAYIAENHGILLGGGCTWDEEDD